MILIINVQPNYQHVFVFLLERAATIVLVLYNWATNYWYIAMASLVISATCNACILNFMPWQKFHKNGIPCPNPCSSLMNLCLSMMNLWKDKVSVAFESFFYLFIYSGGARNLSL